MYKSIQRLVRDSSIEINLFPFFHQAIHLKYVQPELLQCIEAYRYTKNCQKFLESASHSLKSTESVYQLIYTVHQKHEESNLVASYYMLHYLKYLIHPYKMTPFINSIEGMLISYFKISFNFEKIMGEILLDTQLINDLSVNSLIKLMYIAINSSHICDNYNLQVWDILIEKLKKISKLENYQCTFDTLKATRILYLCALSLKNTPKYNEVTKLIEHFSKLAYKYISPVPVYNRVLVEIIKYLNNKKIIYSQEQYLFTYFVDLYIEEYNCAMEINTFYHYYPYIGQNANNETSILKTKILKSVGINLKNVNAVSLTSSKERMQEYLDNFIDSITHK